MIAVGGFSYMIIDKTKQIDKLVKVKHQLYKEYYNKTSKKELIEFNNKLNDIETKLKKLNYSVINNFDIDKSQSDKSQSDKSQSDKSQNDKSQNDKSKTIEKIEVKKLCQTYL